jgi:hypothetical protein
MNLFSSIIDDLRERRLWPVALGLVVALVAVPVVLARKSSSPPATPPPASSATAPPAGALPVVNVAAAPSEVPLHGAARDPFSQRQQAAAAAMTATSPTSTVSAGSGSGSGGSSSGTKSGQSSGSGGSPSGTQTTPSPPTQTPPPATHTPAPPTLTATESYHVVFAITNTSGGFDTIDPLERLSVLPNTRQPMMVELGVLKGGHRVLFVVQPGTVVSGPGTCLPGPVDCEILSLAPEQVEGLSMRTSSGVDPVALFAVTGIKVDKHPSAAAAEQARRAASAAGRRLLSSSTYPALSLFQYEPSVGAVVDQRNLSVGGS